MKRDNYYGSSQVDSLSYLEFGSIDLAKAQKRIWGYWQDETAYDFYMFARYARDLFSFRDFCCEKYKTVEILNQYILNSAHDKIMDYIFKYAGMITSL